MCVRRPFALLFSHHAGICICGEFLSCEIASATGRGARAQKGEGTDEDISKGKRSAAAQKTLQMEKEKRNPPPSTVSSSIPRSLSRQGGRGTSEASFNNFGQRKKISSHGQGEGREGNMEQQCVIPFSPSPFFPPFSLPHTLFPLDAGRIRIRGDCPPLHQSTPPRQEGGRKNIPSAVCRGNNFRRDIPGGKGWSYREKEGGKEGVAFA